MLTLILLSALFSVSIASPLPNGPLLFDRAICPRELPTNGAEIAFPQQIIPISAAQPMTAYPNTYSPTISPSDLSTIFNLYVPSDPPSATCELGFYFPTLENLATSFFTFTGPGNFVLDISQIGTVAVAGTTSYDAQPPSGRYEGFPMTINMQPGNYYSIGRGPCREGWGSVTMSSPDTTFNWFQDAGGPGDCAIGLFNVYE